MHHHQYPHLKDQHPSTRNRHWLGLIGSMVLIVFVVLMKDCKEGENEQEGKEEEKEESSF